MDEDGEPPGKFQNQEVGLLALRSLNEIQVLSQNVESEEEKSDTGGTPITME